MEETEETHTIKPQHAARPASSCQVFWFRPVMLRENGRMKCRKMKLKTTEPRSSKAARKSSQSFDFRVVQSSWRGSRRLLPLLLVQNQIVG